MKKPLFLIVLLLLAFSLISCGDNREPSTQPSPSTPGTDPNVDPVVIQASEKIIHVYLIAGQSNAVGYGQDTDGAIANSDPRFLNGFENVLYYGSQERWSGAYPNTAFEPVKLGMGVNVDRSGAEIGIASALADNGKMNAVIKCAWGATHLYPDTNYDISKQQGTWTSPSYIEKHNIDLSKSPMVGNMYRRFEDTLVNALQLLIEDGYTPVIEGVWWMQGEAEMFTLEMASAYRELYETLIHDTRDLLSVLTGYDCSNVPFVCGLPKWNTKNSPPPTYQGMVRNAMTTVAGEMNNVACIDCMPLNQHDDWHFDAEGQKYLGEKFVEAVEGFHANDEMSFDEKVSMDSEIGLLVDGRGLQFKANLTSYNTENGYEYGFIVVPTAKLDENNISGDYINALDAAQVGYQRFVSEVTVAKIDEVHSDIYFACNISDVLYEDLNTSYTAIAYIKDEYGTYSYSSRYVADSVARLASEELYRSGEDAEKLQQIVDEAINFLNGVAFENRTNEANFDLTLGGSITLTFSESGTRYKLNVGKSNGVDFFVRFSSSDPAIVSVDQSGVLTAKDRGVATITVECAGRTQSVEVTVDYINDNGIILDGVVSENEYLGEAITATNGNVDATFAGMTRDGKLYLALELVHGAWSPLSSDWWKNDNIELKINNGASCTVVFYEGVAKYSENISLGVSKTVEVDGKLVTTVELCMENVDDVCQLSICMNGANFGWFPALWHQYVNKGFVTPAGIAVSTPIVLNNGIVLDGVFDEGAYTESVKNNVVTANGNGANVTIMGTLTGEGVLLGVTVDHTVAPDVPLAEPVDWFKYMNIEFHFNGGSDQYLCTAINDTTFSRTWAYCKSVQTDSGYRSTFEFFVPYDALGVSSDVAGVNFTARGWFETGWCDLLNNSWLATHTVTAEGLSAI